MSALRAKKKRVLRPELRSTAFRYEPRRLAPFIFDTCQGLPDIFGLRRLAYARRAIRLACPLRPLSRSRGRRRWSSSEAIDCKASGNKDKSMLRERYRGVGRYECGNERGNELYARIGTARLARVVAVAEAAVVDVVTVAVKV